MQSVVVKLIYCWLAGALAGGLENQLSTDVLTF
jgi:hypothetical protein